MIYASNCDSIDFSPEKKNNRKNNHLINGSRRIEFLNAIY